MKLASQLLATWTGAQRPMRAILVVTAAISGGRCQGCARCDGAPVVTSALPAAVSPPPARDASLPAPGPAPRDLWMEQRIQRILQRQRVALEAAPRAPSRPRAVVSAAGDAGHPVVASTVPVPVDAGRPLGAPVDRSPRPDPARLEPLRRELDETRAEIARVGALAREVRARASGASSGEQVVVELGRVERELAELRTLHRALTAELTALEGAAGRGD